MKFHEISELIRKGEYETIEFKKSLAESREIGETVCAFLNKRGGVILIGVDDDGNVVGVRVRHGTLENLSNFIRETIRPKPIFSIEVYAVENKVIIFIEIPEGRDKPYFFKGRAFIRIDAVNKLLEREEIFEMASRYLKPFDILKVGEDVKYEIDEKLVRRIIELARKRRGMKIEFEDVDSILKRLSIKGRNAEILLFSKNTSLIYPQARIKIIVIRNKNVIDETEICGNLFEQLEKTIMFLKKHMFKGFEIHGLERIEKWEYPLEAIREGLINAIIHRNYFINAPIFIRLEDLKLTIYNPGSLPKQLSVKDLYIPHPSIVQNPLIAKVFYYAGLIEEWGTGTLRIIRELRKNNLPLPVWEEKQGFVWLKFRKWEEILNDTEKTLLEILVKERNVYEISNLLKLTERRVRDILKKLLNLGLIERKKINRKYVYYRKI